MFDINIIHIFILIFNKHILPAWDIAPTTCLHFCEVVQFFWVKAASFWAHGIFSLLTLDYYYFLRCIFFFKKGSFVLIFEFSMTSFVWLSCYFCFGCLYFCKNDGWCTKVGVSIGSVKLIKQNKSNRTEPIGSVKSTNQTKLIGLVRFEKEFGSISNFLGFDKLNRTKLSSITDQFNLFIRTNAHP